MSCSLVSLGSDGVMTGQEVELLVINLSMPFSSSMSAIKSRDASWFEAWQPSQDSLSLTFRQQSIADQMMTIQILQRWCKLGTMLHIAYPERDIDYDCVIDSCPLELDYSAVMKDCTVHLTLLTNSFIQSMESFQYSPVAARFFDQDIEQSADTVPSVNGKTDTTLSSVDAMFRDKPSSISGYDISYGAYPYITVTKKGWQCKYSVKLDDKLRVSLVRGDDILHSWLDHNAESKIRK